MPSTVTVPEEWPIVPIVAVNRWEIHPGTINYWKYVISDILSSRNLSRSSRLTTQNWLRSFVGKWSSISRMPVSSSRRVTRTWTRWSGAWRKFTPWALSPRSWSYRTSALGWASYWASIFFGQVKNSWEWRAALMTWSDLDVKKSFVVWWVGSGPNLMYSLGPGLRALSWPWHWPDLDLSLTIRAG